MKAVRTSALVLIPLLLASCAKQEASDPVTDDNSHSGSSSQVAHLDSGHGGNDPHAENGQPAGHDTHATTTAHGEHGTEQRATGEAHGAGHQNHGKQSVAQQHTAHGQHSDHDDHATGKTDPHAGHNQATGNHGKTDGHNAATKNSQPIHAPDQHGQPQHGPAKTKPASGNAKVGDHGHTAGNTKPTTQTHGNAHSDPHGDHGSTEVALNADTAELDRIIAAARDPQAGATNPNEIFAKRILPIMQSKNASSCTACHFSGVELRDFVNTDQAKTFASLKAGGLIDVENPDQSKLLRFIARKPSKSDALLDKVRENELIAFRSWIRAAVKDPALLNATSTVELGTKVPDEVIRHARKDRVLTSFLDNVWNETGRCINCHNPERNRNRIGKNNETKEDVDAISWMVPNDPEATLRKLVDGGNIDLENPRESYVLTKPSGLEEHGGGPKFLPGSDTFRKFERFVTDYAAVNSGKYKTATDLPKPPTEINLPTEQQLKIVRIPESLRGLRMQVDLYRWNPQDRTWSPERWATGFSMVNPKDLVWQNPIALTAAVDSKLAEEFRKLKMLPTGTYLAKLYVDRQKQSDKDPMYQMQPSDYLAEFEVSGEWKPGYQPPKIVTFPESKK